MIITAISKTLFIFDTEIGKVNIPLNKNKLEEKKEWYYLKNKNEENVISILISTYNESNADRSIIENNQNSTSYIEHKSALVLNNNNN